MPISQGKSHNVYYQAQDILSRRDHSEKEIVQKLTRKGFSQEQIQNALEWLSEKDLVDDRRFAINYAEQILRSKPVGPKWIQVKLKQRGIESDIILETLARTYETDSETKHAQAAKERWQHSHPKPSSDDPKEQAAYKQKMIRHLTSRGFSYNAIEATV